MSRRQSTSQVPSRGASSNSDLNVSASTSASHIGTNASANVPSGSGIPSTSASTMNILNEVLGLGSPISTALGRHSENKRTVALNGIGGTFDSKNHVDLLCPICFEVITEAHITRCGHTFCHPCILKSIEQFKRCPKCSSTITSLDQVFPNYSLDELIKKQKRKTQLHDILSNNSADIFTQNNSDENDICDSASSKRTSESDALKQFLTSESQKMSLPDVKVILDILQERKQILEAESSMTQNKLLHDFLKQLLLQREKKRTQVEKEIALIRNDLRKVESVIKEPTKDRQKLDKTISDEDISMDDNEHVNDISGASTSSAAKSTTLSPDDGFNTLKTDPSTQTYVSRKRRMYAHFDDFVTSYFSIRSQDLLFGNNGDSTISPANEAGTNASTSTEMKIPTIPAENSLTKRPRDTLNIFRDNLIGFSKYNTLRPLATMQYASDLHNNSTIVSTIVFDKDNEFFAIGGVTRRIKVFDYLAVVRDTVDLHYPNVEMVSSSKISCITWNSYHKNIMASSDYEGAVNLWDVQTGIRSKCFHEHEKRCWSVDFNDVDSRLIASGSDDARVKLWTLNDEHSVATLEAKANVCCVKFNPNSSCHLAFGSADHDVHYYDLRNMTKPLCIFKGHKKAVSYVKFLNTNEIISASTDSQLKLWNVNEPPYSLRSFVGHVNEKNFVGLATDRDYLACGSEDNALYIYYKGVSKPLFNYKIDGTPAGSKANNGNGSSNSRNSNSALTGINETDRFSDVNEFVSAVCWRKHCNVVLAANSRGVIKILELV